MRWRNANTNLAAFHVPEPHGDLRDHEGWSHPFERARMEKLGRTQAQRSTTVSGGA